MIINSRSNQDVIQYPSARIHCRNIVIASRARPLNDDLHPGGSLFLFLAANRTHSYSVRNNARRVHCHTTTCLIAQGVRTLAVNNVVSTYTSTPIQPRAVPQSNPSTFPTGLDFITSLLIRWAS